MVIPRHTGFRMPESSEDGIQPVYVDSDVPMLARMYMKRLKGYQAIGYSVEEEERRICETH